MHDDRGAPVSATSGAGHGERPELLSTERTGRASARPADLALDQLRHPRAHVEEARPLTATRKKRGIRTNLLGSPQAEDPA